MPERLEPSFRRWSSRSCSRDNRSCWTLSEYVSSPRGRQKSHRRAYRRERITRPLARCAASSLPEGLRLGSTTAESKGRESSNPVRSLRAVRSNRRSHRSRRESHFPNKTGLANFQPRPGSIGPNQLRRWRPPVAMPASAARHLYHSAPRLTARLERAA
jgi:hypothetical protein